jgi:hypothetical protein
MNNAERAEKAFRTMLVFMQYTGLTRADGYETAITDLIADLQHLCDEQGIEFAEVLRVAEDHYQAELAEETHSRTT